MTCVLCVTGGRRAETKDRQPRSQGSLQPALRSEGGQERTLGTRLKDRYYLYHNAISREFQSRHESGAFVGKSIFSLWTVACQTKVISYASVTKMALPTDIIHGKSKFYAFYVEMMFGSSRADYLQLFMICSIVEIVLALESTHQGLVFQRGKIMLLSFQPQHEPKTCADEMQTKASLKQSKKD